MKAQIITTISLLLAGIYTFDKFEEKPISQVTEEVRTVTTEDLIRKTPLYQDLQRIQKKQDTVAKLVRESIPKDKIIDSVIINQDSINKSKDTVKN